MPDPSPAAADHRAGVRDATAFLGAPRPRFGSGPAPGSIGMNDPRIPFGCLPMLGGVTLILLGQHEASELLGRLGLLAFGCGALVLAAADGRQP